MALLKVSRTAWEILVTLFLFTKSDFSTAVFPVTLMAIAATPFTTPLLVLHSFFWVWLHVLQFDVSNQTVNPVEDELNKRDRPLPSKRISLQRALLLRWSLVPMCFLLSMCYSRQVLWASIGISALTLLHNELSAHCHWVGKNLTTALGLTAFEAGAILITGVNHEVLSPTAQRSLLCNTGIVWSTIYAQDFRDVAGDAQIGRKTLPVMYPTLAAPAMAATILGWSIFLVNLWGINFAASLVFGVIAMFAAFSYLASTSAKGYQRSYHAYNVWMTIAQCLPLLRSMQLYAAR